MPSSKVRDITTKLENINQEAVVFGLNIRQQIEAALLPSPTPTTVSRQTDSILPLNVVGRANDESTIVDKLLSSSEEIVHVIPIVGMGGLGKTTLAKAVYNNPQIVGHFGKKIWVCVSEKFEGLELFKLILESLTERKVEHSSKDAIVQKIRRKLKGKRYLLVLDDVWNEEHKLWDDFFDSLLGLIPSNGSRCLVTTRLEQVASIVSRHSPHSLGKLSDDDCWLILKEKAIARGEVPQELNNIKHQILKICDGLPLAASVLGGLLRTKGKENWLSIVKKGLAGENSIQAILKLSFDNLPSRSIKKCFAYCSIFAKDTNMEKDMLIEHWMAEGFLQPDLGNQSTMEEIGEQYLKVLLQNSLLEEVEYHGKPQCKMHNLVHDLAASISKPETIKLEKCDFYNHCQVRYLALNSSGYMPGEILKAISTSVRTLILTRGISSDELPKLKNLYVLNLSRAYDLNELPTSIGELIHLQLLILPYSQIDTLPESICKLYCLQTLRTSRLKDLPKEMSNLISLRHFHYSGDDGGHGFQMPLEMGRLSCLQTLEFFNVGEEKGRQIEELGPLKDLKGKLVIRNLELVNGKESAEGANLSGKPNLVKLELKWRNMEGSSCDDELEGLQPHSNLQELIIDGFMGDPFPQWFMKLSKLVDLRLRSCKNCKEFPAALGQLPSLQKLEFDGLANVTCIDLSFYSDDCIGGGESSSSTRTSRKLFPALKKLTLKDMENLVEWKKPDETVDELFPKLEKLIILDCIRLENFPSHLTSLQKLVIKRNDYISGEHVCRFQSLRSLEIAECPRFGLKGLTVANANLEQLSLLEYLEIIDCPSLTSIPSEVLQSNTSLKYLWVHDCPELVFFPTLESLQQIPRLSSLESKCPKLMTMPKGFGSLTGLGHLGIGPFSDDSLIKNEFDWSELIPSSTLESLTLYGMPHGESYLPNQLQYLTTLRYLDLWEFGEMEALPNWLGNLASLEWLELRDCKKLRYLPSEAAMGRLTKLRYLKVYDCPLLKERCSPQSGPDSEWSKISHIRGCDIR